jgi:hypothetical protein
MNVEDQGLGRLADNRLEVNVSRTTLKARNITVLAHELGHNLSGSHMTYHLVGAVLSESMADVTNYLLTNKPYTGSPSGYKWTMRNLRDSPEDAGTIYENIKNARTIVDVPFDPHDFSVLTSRFFVDLKQDPRTAADFERRFALVRRTLSPASKDAALNLETWSNIIYSEIKKKYSVHTFYSEQHWPVVAFHIAAAIMIRASPKEMRQSIVDIFLKRGGDSEILTPMFR